MYLYLYLYLGIKVVIGKTIACMLVTPECLCSCLGKKQPQGSLDPPRGVEFGLFVELDSGSPLVFCQAFVEIPRFLKRDSRPFGPDARLFGCLY